MNAAPQISRKIARCRSHMTTIRNKMDGNVRTLEVHSANDAAASELKLGAQRLINLEIPVLVRSLKSSNVELG